MNYFSVFFGAVAAMVIGYVWYGPLFGKPWMKLVGMTKEKMEAAKSEMPKTYGIMLVSALVMAYILGKVLIVAQAQTLFDAVKWAFWIWLGFIATFALSGVLFEKKSWNLYLINIGYYLVTLCVIAGIFVTMR